MSVQQSVLLADTQGEVATLTLNRPQQYNALSDELLEALGVALDDIAQSKQVRVVVLKANGKAFCAGHDLKQMRANSSETYIRNLFSKCSGVMQKIASLPQPVIASVHGMATAAGCQLVATCDLAVSSEEAKFAASGINIGLFCSTPAVALSRNITPKQAMNMLMTGDFINANQALDYGLLNQIVKGDELDKTVTELADKIAKKPPEAVRLGKELFYKQLTLPLNSAYEVASDAISCNFFQSDALEGIDAFIEKRDPSWKR